MGIRRPIASFPRRRKPSGKWGGARAPGVRGAPCGAGQCHATASTRPHPGLPGGDHYGAPDQGASGRAVAGSHGRSGGVRSADAE